MSARTGSTNAPLLLLASSARLRWAERPAGVGRPCQVLSPGRYPLLRPRRTDAVESDCGEPRHGCLKSLTRCVAREPHRAQNRVVPSPNNHRLWLLVSELRLHGRFSKFPGQRAAIPQSQQTDTPFVETTEWLYLRGTFLALPRRGLWPAWRCLSGEAS